MKRLTVVDKENGEMLHNIEFSGGYNITYANLQESGNLKYIRTLSNGKYDEKRIIKNYMYYPIAEKLIEKFDEFEHVVLDRILFLEDMEWKPGSADKPWIARTSKANKQLDSMSGYEYVIEIRNYFAKDMSKEQIAALIYHEMKHIGDGIILKHDVEDWDSMIATLGTDWATTKAKITDILADDFEEWDELRKVGTQISVFDKTTPKNTSDTADNASSEQQTEGLRIVK